jgi:hypothetical protein
VNEIKVYVTGNTITPDTDLRAMARSLAQYVVEEINYRMAQ